MFRESFFIHVHFVLKTYECPMGYRHILEGISQLAGVVTPNQLEFIGLQRVFQAVRFIIMVIVEVLFG